MPTFTIPQSNTKFDIPDEWWTFVEMSSFTPGGGGFYLPPPKADFNAIPITDVEPPMRDDGIIRFKKYKLVPVLFAFRSPDCALPPVQVIPAIGCYRYKVTNGYHRFYASVAVGFKKIPVAVS